MPIEVRIWRMADERDPVRYGPNSPAGQRPPSTRCRGAQSTSARRNFDTRGGQILYEKCLTAGEQNPNIAPVARRPHRGHGPARDRLFS